MTLPAFRELPAERRSEQRARLLVQLGARPRRRRIAVVVLAGAVLVATPALALHRQVVDFFSAEPAPERIQLDFQSLRERNEEWRREGRYAPPITPEGPAREVLTVTLDGERRGLSVVPTKEGSFCMRLHFTASCVTDRHAGPPIGNGGLATSDGRGLQWIYGSVRDRAVEQLELLYQGGERVKLPYVWVSPPIDAGFYAFDVPEEHEVSGRLPVILLGLDEDGELAAHACLRLHPEDLERVASDARDLCERPR